MIKVLRDWAEIGAAVTSLQERGLPMHETPQKNWDHALLCGVLGALSPDASIVDLGCGEGYTLALLHQLGFVKLHGVDFRVPWRARARLLLTMYRERTLSLPWRVRAGDIVETPFRDESFEAAISVSTIEHGVNPQAFLEEACRLLKQRGLLFVTTDYWEEKLTPTTAEKPFGLPWRVLCREDIVDFVARALALGFTPLQGQEVPPCQERPVYWNGARYTFVAMAFRKGSRPCSTARPAESPTGSQLGAV